MKHCIDPLNPATVTKYRNGKREWSELMTYQEAINMVKIPRWKNCEFLIRTVQVFSYK